MAWGLNEEGDNIDIPNPLPVVEKTLREKVRGRLFVFLVDVGSLSLLYECLYVRIQLCLVGMGALGERDRLDGYEWN